MAEVEPMKIDGTDERQPKLDGPDQKKTLKRKRLDPSLYTVSPEEKLAKINTFREEVNNLVKFCKDLASENRGALLEHVEKVGCSAATLNCVVACLMEESDLPFSKLVDEIYEKVTGKLGNGESITRASVKSTVLMIGQRLSYGVTNADADLLEDDSDSALWCWETRDLKLMPKSLRVSAKVRRTARKKIHERIETVSAMINALEKSEDRPNGMQGLIKASEKLGKVLNEADIRLLMESMLQKNGAEMAEKEVKKEEKQLIKQMEKNKREEEKARKKMDKETQKKMLQSEKELRRLHDESQKEERRREKEENEMQKLLRKQQEEAEKEKKRKAKEEAELKKQHAVKKQASLMEQFLKRNKNSSQHNISNKVTTSPPSSNVVEQKSETTTAVMDSILAQNVGLEEEVIWRSHLNSWHSIGRLIRSKRNVHWAIRKKPKIELVKELKLTSNGEMACDEDTSIQKDVDGLIDHTIDNRPSQINMDGPLPNCQKRMRSIQLLQFDKSHRPAFYGVWPRKSQVVKSQHPFTKDPEIDYEIDSDEEWEEVEPGESLSDCDKDDEDESIEEHSKVDDEDESEDGFFVPDGYLSENEGVEVDGDMETDELIHEVRPPPGSEKQLQSEEFCLLLRKQKYLNHLTEHALKKNSPLIIMNLMHEKTTSLPAEELSGTEKLEKMCLQSLCICPFPDYPNMEISVHNDEVDDDLEVLSTKPSATPIAPVAAIHDSDLPQIISIINSCPHGIGKIVKSLHNVFPALPKIHLRNKVREISEFTENRWQVKKEILSKHSVSITPENNSRKRKSISSFFTKRCLPPSCKTTPTSTESSPQVQPSLKRADIVVPQLDFSNA
ncbi:hypothetical protein ACS0TY_005044 [Phlomoides rotata]